MKNNVIKAKPDLFNDGHCILAMDEDGYVRITRTLFDHTWIRK